MCVYLPYLYLFVVLKLFFFVLHKQENNEPDPVLKALSRISIHVPLCKIKYATGYYKEEMYIYICKMLVIILTVVGRSFRFFNGQA